MRRGEWIQHLARVLYMRPETLTVVQRRAQESGAVSTGARGINAKPYTDEEKRRILESVVTAMCVGTLETVDVRHTLQRLEWREDGLWAVRGGGLKVTAHIPKHLLDAALAC